MASFLYECFFQFIKHFLKSRSYKDLAFLFRKKKRLLNNCWVSGTHLVLPWCLHTDFQASLSYISNDGESELLSWLPHTSRTRQRHTSSLAQHCSQALSTYKDAKWYSQGSTSPRVLSVSRPSLFSPILCSAPQSTILLSLCLTLELLLLSDPQAVALNSGSLCFSENVP